MAAPSKKRAVGKELEKEEVKALEEESEDEFEEEMEEGDEEQDDISDSIDQVIVLLSLAPTMRFLPGHTNHRNGQKWTEMDRNGTGMDRNGTFFAEKKK